VKLTAAGSASSFLLIFSTDHFWPIPQWTASWTAFDLAPPMWHIWSIYLSGPALAIQVDFTTIHSSYLSGTKPQVWPVIDRTVASGSSFQDYREIRCQASTTSPSQSYQTAQLVIPQMVVDR
jgi:hypothetical protein